MGSHTMVGISKVEDPGTRDLALGRRSEAQRESGGVWREVPRGVGRLERNDGSGTNQQSGMTLTPAACAQRLPLNFTSVRPSLIDRIDSAFLFWAATYSCYPLFSDSTQTS